METVPENRLKTLTYTFNIQVAFLLLKYTYLMDAQRKISRYNVCKTYLSYVLRA